MNKFFVVLALLLVVILFACGESKAPQQGHVCELPGPEPVSMPEFGFNPCKGPDTRDASAFVHAEVLQVYQELFYDPGVLTYSDEVKPYVILKCRVIDNFFSQYQDPEYTSWMSPGSAFFCWIYVDNRGEFPEKESALIDFYRQMDALIVYGNNFIDGTFFRENETPDDEIIANLLEQDPELPVVEEGQYTVLRTSIRVELNSAYIVPIQEGMFDLLGYMDAIRTAYTGTDYTDRATNLVGPEPIYYAAHNESGQYYFSLMGWGEDGLSEGELYEIAQNIAREAAEKSSYSTWS